MWVYSPYPATEENIPLIGERLLRNVWQDASHADLAAYREWQRTTKWHVRALQRLKNLPHIFCQWLRDVVASDENLDDDLTNLPRHIHRTDLEQPEGLAHCKLIFRAVPKKRGSKITVDFRDSGSDSDAITEAWGLEFEESFRIHRLLFFMLLLYASGSLAVMVWLLKNYDLNLPSALGPLLSIIGWLGSLLVLTCTVWFKWAENPNPR